MSTMALWRRRIEQAQHKGEALERAVEAREQELDSKTKRATAAISRAERAAAALLASHDGLLEAVAQARQTGR